MAADVPVENVPVHPCCKMWKDKCSDLEKRRKYLRQAVKLWENEHQKERAKAEAEKYMKEKEVALRLSLEKEISVLKSEVSLLKQTRSVDNKREEVKLLHDCVGKGQQEVSQIEELHQKEEIQVDSEKKISEGRKEGAADARKCLEKEKPKHDEKRNCASEIPLLKQQGSIDLEHKSEEIKLLQDRLAKGEKEINRLKELLEKEKIRADAEKRTADAKKKSAADAWKHVEEEKAKIDEERKYTNNEVKKAQEYRLQLEGLKKKADEANLKLASVTTRVDELSRMLEAKKYEVIQERKRADSEIAKLVEYRKLAEASEKKAMEQKSCAENLSQQLKDARRRIEELQKGDVEYQLQFAVLKKEVDEAKSKLVSQTLKFKEASSKLEAEKHKVIKARNSAESQMVKAEEQRKLAEENRKMAVDEKSRADRLAHQLEEYRIKIEELQKEVREPVSSRVGAEYCTIPPGNGPRATTTKVKLLKQQLKLEKTRLKHAKQVAKLEKSHSCILMQELSQLKVDFFQISCRLNALTTCFSLGAEGTEGKQKVRHFANLKKSKVSRQLCGFEPRQQHPQTESQLLEPSCEPMAANDLGQTLATSLLPLGGQNCGGSISGIDSKLESLHGVSNRKLLESSAINSSSASFSDGQLVGTQERGAFVTTARKFAEEKFNAQPTISRMSGEVTTIPDNQNLAVAENSVGSPHSVGRVRRSRKRKRMVDAIESVELLYAEGKKLHLQMDKKLSLLHGLLNREVDKGLQQKYVDKKVGSCAKFLSCHNKIETSHEERMNVQGLSDISLPEKPQNIVNEACGGANTSKQDLACDNIQMGTLEACKNVLDVETVDGFKAVAFGNFMKLLDLDNRADEECYRRALQMPMSPTLPEIGLPTAEMFEEDKLDTSFDGSFQTGLQNDKGNIDPSHSFDVSNVPIGSSNFEGNASASGASYNELLHENEGPGNSYYLFGDSDGIDNTVDTEKVCGDWVGDLGVGVEIPKSSDTLMEANLRLPLESDLLGLCDNMPAYCVIFSNLDDKKRISRIFGATRSCMARCCLDTKTEGMVQKILHALEMEDRMRMSPMEKACVFFTLLLLDLSVHTLCGSGGSFGKDSFPYLDLVAGHINAVASDVETRSLFAEACFFDELLALVENFLLERRVLVYTSPQTECDSKRSILLDGENINLSYRAASPDQLVAGAIILAFICASIDRIGFICEVSYRLLRMHKYDTAVMLTMLHLFARICGDKYLSPDKYGCTMTVVKSVVMFLEGKHSSVASTSRLSMTNGTSPEISPCAKCPFSEDALSIDDVASELLEKIQSCALSESVHPPLVFAASLLNSSDLGNEVPAKQCLGCEKVHLATDMNSDSCFSSNNCAVVASLSEAIAAETLCDISDLLSLVELLACNMNWVWTCSKIVPVMLDLLEKAKLENHVMAFIILLGQLGRLGILACGYEDEGVKSLRQKLSGYLQPRTSTGVAFPVQIAVAIALLDLMPLDFESVIQRNLKLPAVAGLSDFIDLIKDWFSSLDKEQRTLAFGLVQSAGVV